MAVCILITVPVKTTTENQENAVKILTSSITMATKMGIELHLQLHGKTLIKKTNFLSAKSKRMSRKFKLKLKLASNCECEMHLNNFRL